MMAVKESSGCVEVGKLAPQFCGFWLVLLLLLIPPCTSCACREAAEA